MACWPAPWLNAAVTRNSAGVQVTGAARDDEAQAVSVRTAKAVTGSDARMRIESARMRFKTDDGHDRLDAALVTAGMPPEAGHRPVRGLSGEGFQACGDFPVAVDGDEVDAVEGAAVAEPEDLLAGSLDAGRLVACDLVGEPGGDLDIGDGGGQAAGHRGTGQDHDAGVDGHVGGVGITPAQLGVG